MPVLRLIIKNKNFLACDWFKNVLFTTNSLAKLLSDSLLSKSLTSQSHSKMQPHSQGLSSYRPWERGCQRCNLNQPITFKVVTTCASAPVAFVFLPLTLSLGQTIATCQPNISQHCWAQHVVYVWPPCCKMLRGVGCCWHKFDHFQT